MEPVNKTEDSGEKNPRLQYYKKRPEVDNQEVRRSKLLQEQKLRRENSFEAARNLDDIFNEEEENEDVKVEKPKLPKLKDLFMFSEWMMNMPEGFEEYWYFKMCPAGKRCLVRSSRGSTIVYSKRGHIMKKFQSALPNGSKRGYDGKYYNSEEVILDCIWSAQTKSYYVLDLLRWKGQSFFDTDGNFRNFWLRSKLSEEMTWLLEKSQKNPFPFIPLEPHRCDPCTISSVMNQFPYFPLNEPKLDGLLFYHGDASYTAGTSPLVVWLKPFMVPELMGENVMISDEYYKTRPDNYLGMTDYITKFDEKTEEMKKKQFRRKKKLVDVEMADAEVEEPIEVDMTPDTTPEDVDDTEVE